MKTLSLLCLCGLLACQSSRSRSSQPGPQPAASWPRLVDRLPELDTSRVLTLPGDSLRIFRTDLTVTFKTDVSDSAKAVFFARHAMRVIGVTPAERFFVRIPDPGAAPEKLLQVLTNIRSEPEIAYAGWILRDPPRGN